MILNHAIVFILGLKHSASSVMLDHPIILEQEEIWICRSWYEFSKKKKCWFHQTKYTYRPNLWFVTSALHTASHLNCKQIHLKVVYINQGLANFFSKGSDRNYSRLCRWDIWSPPQLLTAAIVEKKIVTTTTAIGNMWMCSNEKLFIKITAGPIWSIGHRLSTPDLDHYFGPALNDLS